MINKYYNNDRLQYAIELERNGQFYRSLSMIQGYLDKYPDDQFARTAYCSILLRLGNFEEAENQMNQIVINKYTGLDVVEQLKLINVYLLSYQGKYEECYQLLESEPKLYNKCRTSFINYLRKKVGLPLADNQLPTNYVIRQIEHYDEQLAIAHISEHYETYSPLLENEEDEEKSLFLDTFPLEQVYYQLRKILPTDIKIYGRGYNNTYHCKFNNCGKINDKIFDYFNVCTFKDTNDIITMYPCERVSNMPYIDLNPTVEIDIQKVKRPSQIDKFNQKYGIK